jgi:hypothetical protein
VNERIEAYLKQHYCRDYFNRYGEMVEDDYYFMYREEVDGLIELIVRECASKVTRNEALNIFEHFGVEE